MHTRSYVKTYYDPSKDFRQREPSAPPPDPLISPDSDSSPNFNSHSTPEFHSSPSSPPASFSSPSPTPSSPSSSPSFTSYQSKTSSWYFHWSTLVLVLVGAFLAYFFRCHNAVFYYFFIFNISFLIFLLTKF